MPRFAANVSTMFADLPVAERFAAARAVGFQAVEYLFPYGESPMDIRYRLRESDIRMILLNTPLGDASAGERGLAAVPGRQADFKDHFQQSLSYARTLEIPMIHVLAGVVAEEQRSDAEVVFAENVRHAADVAATYGIRILLEPLNHEDTPGYLLTLTAEARRLIKAIDRDNVRMQYDLYHRQIMEGNLARGIADNLDLIAHIQFSSVPGRHEPQFGEVNMPYLFEVCDRLGYDGWIGCEYRPMTTAAEGLSWGRPYGLGRNP